MPRPAILPVIDWKGVFDSGQRFAEWVKGGEHRDNCERIRADLAALSVEPHEAAYLEALPRPIHVVAIAEAWCGDVVRHVAVLERLAHAAPNIAVRYIGRGQRPDVFVRFLTNGGEAIPKFIFLSGAFVECGNWGPMPAACRELIARGKACGNVAAAREKVAALYNADPDRRIVIAELLHLIGVASSSRP
ncbi:MAG TPA: thioredoxin family protein [Candidatus Hydrogenedentes bacterium]|nr:thioredoxin family protein [Candidatus Hydrogenedentota bacterium]